MGLGSMQPEAAGSRLTLPCASIYAWFLTPVCAEPCLGLEKTIAPDFNPARALRDRIKATVATHIQEHPDATLQQLIEHVLQKHGVTLKPPTMCVIRQRLGLAPDNQQSRAAKARHRCA